MIKAISKIGNSQGLIFDSTLIEMAHLAVGDKVNIEVHEGGTITLTPVRKRIAREDVSKTIKGAMEDYSRTLRRLA